MEPFQMYWKTQAVPAHCTVMETSSFWEQAEVCTMQIEGENQHMQCLPPPFCWYKMSGTTSTPVRLWTQEQSCDAFILVPEMLERGKNEGRAFKRLKVSLYVFCGGGGEKVSQPLSKPLKLLPLFCVCFSSGSFIFIILCLLFVISEQWMAAGCSMRAGRLEEQHVDKAWRCQVLHSLWFHKHSPGQTDCVCGVTDGVTVTLDPRLKADFLILLTHTSSQWAFAASPGIRAECCQDAH